MKRLLLAAIVAMAASGPAWAQTTRSLGPNIMNDPGPGSTIAVAGGLNLGHVFTGTGATSAVGGISTGLGASVGQSNAVSGAASIGNGAAITGGVSNNIGVGVGGGFTNVLP